MSICDRCIHDEVCGLEDNHEDAMTFCADMKPKDILDKIRAEIMKLQTYKMFEGEDAVYVECEDVLQVIDNYTAESEGTDADSN